MPDRIASRDLVGVSALAAALGRSKGTISKHAESGKIPVADRDASGFPLFDVGQVRAAYESSVNPLMRRRGAAAVDADGSDEAPDDAGPDPAAESERRSLGIEREPSGLLKAQITERNLRNRRLAGDLATREGALVLKAVVDNDVVTMARQTRDGVAAQMADYAGKLYAFAARQPTEGELRVWLNEHTGAAFDEVEKAIAAEKGDEFGEPDDDGQLQSADAAPAAQDSPQS